MLPGFRILFALVVLSFAILIFGFGALALLRTAHQSLANQPAWQQDWRTPVEIANARRDDRQTAPSDTQTLALLRVEPTAAQSDTPPTRPRIQDERDDKPVDATADVSAPPPPAPVTPAPVADTNDGETRVTAAAPAETGTPGEKTADETTSVPSIDDAKKVAPPGEAPKLADTANPPDDPSVTPAPTGSDTSAAPAKTREGEPTHETSDAAASRPTSDPPMKLAARQDATTASNEPKQQARPQSARQSDAAELRAKRRARARLRARRLALARARAARLAQTQQTTTNSSYYNSNFTTTGSSAANSTPNATPFGAPRAAP